MHIQPFRRWLPALATLAVSFSTIETLARAADQRLNVLFIIADDLRPELGCYSSLAKTPTIDKLAQRGVVFDRAYCQQALCNPSRSSFLTGIRPDTLGLWTNAIHFRERRPDVITLPQYFKQHGYVTRDVGKIFHNWHTKEHGDAVSWSAPEFLHYANHGQDKPSGTSTPDLATAPNCQRMAVSDSEYYDGKVANEAVRVLGEIKDKPFLLAVGFWKPHAPFNAPDRYWKLYDQTPFPNLSANPPEGAPALAFHDSRELRGVPPKQKQFGEADAKQMRQGYLANITYMDTQLAKVLAALEQHGLADSTVIVFTSDHGYHLGEHGLWAKTSCFELDARVPLIIAAPKMKQAGVRTSSLVELLDLFPTLSDLCGLPASSGLEGVSLRPVLENANVELKKGVFTQHPRPAYFDRTEKGIPDAMGYSVRTDKVRYTEWREWETDRLVASELYEHATDPNESRNAITTPSDPAALADAKATLNTQFPPGARVKR